MKKLILLLAALLAAPSALGQSVGASQIKKKANGGLVADSANALAVGVYRGTSAPASPVAGQLWCDTNTTPCTLKSYDGSAWGATPTTTAITLDDLSAFPASPVDGQIAWVESQKRAIVYSAATSKWYYLDATNSVAGADYSLEAGGYSTSFLSSPGATTGSLAAGGSMTAGAHSCAITHYSSTGGETLPGGTLTLTTGAANNTMALSFAATGTGVAGKRVYCSKAGTTTPLWFVATINDTTTSTYNVTVADGSFGVATAPDTDFSAPLPSPWVYYAKDLTYGGCGSTGASMMCAIVKNDANATTSVGVRLLYPITTDPDGWRATWRIDRVATNFATAAVGSVGDVAPIATLLADDDLAAPLSRALYLQLPFGTTPAFPPSAVNTPVLLAQSRAAGAAWAAMSGSNTRAPYPPIKGLPIYVSVVSRKSGVNHGHWIAASANGLDFTAGYGATTVTLNQNECLAAGLNCTDAVQLAFVGIELGHGAVGALANTGVYELSSFRWTSE